MSYPPFSQDSHDSNRISDEDRSIHEGYASTSTIEEARMDSGAVARAPAPSPASASASAPAASVLIPLPQKPVLSLKPAKLLNGALPKEVDHEVETRTGKKPMVDKKSLTAANKVIKKAVRKEEELNFKHRKLHDEAKGAISDLYRDLVTSVKERTKLLNENISPKTKKVESAAEITYLKQFQKDAKKKLEKHRRELARLKVQMEDKSELINSLKAGTRPPTAAAGVSSSTFQPTERQKMELRLEEKKRKAEIDLDT
jgi:hypothetical protein